MASGAESAYPAAIGRRLLTVPLLVLAFTVLLIASPVLLLGAFLLDAVRLDRGRPSVRLVGFLVGYLGLETLGVLWAGWIWLTQPVARTSWTERNHRLQMWWTRSLVRAAGPVLGLHLEVELHGPVRPGPLVVLARHVSIVDALLPAYVLGVEEDLRLRYVLTRGLKLDPCLDIAGHRLPNHFIDRAGVDSAAELTALERLAWGMGPDDAVVIFPEGGLFSVERRERALARLADRGSDRLEAARALQLVLPPRPAGTLALLDAAPDADVLVVSHRGFEPMASLRRLWHNLPLPEPVILRVERHPRESIPEDHAERVRWLDARWAEMDAWLAGPAPRPWAVREVT